MARILVAGIQAEIDRVCRTMSHAHELVTAKTLETAVNQIHRQGVDLIICGVQFDDSRMFELLSTLKNNGHREVPFIVLRELPTRLSAQIEEISKEAVLLLGATDYITSERLDDAGLVCALEGFLSRRNLRAS
jgi:CheY-like chemotaxis protein